MANAGRGFKRKLTISLAIFVILIFFGVLYQDQIIKHIYKQRYLDNLESNAASRSGRQTKILNFNFPLNGLDYFYAMGNIQANDEKKWLDADLKIGSENYNIEFSNFENYFKRLKLENKNRSFTIRYKPGDAGGTENEYNLFQVNRIDFYEQDLIYDLAGRLKIYTPDTEHVNVFVNYIDQGDYYLKQSYSKHFVEYSGLGDAYIFMVEKDGKGGWTSRFLWNEPKKKAIKNHFIQFFRLLKKQDPNLMEKYFDLEYLARIEVLRRLLGAETGFTIEDNIRFVCKKSNGKFYPILDESNIYNMQKGRQNKNFKLLSRQINRSEYVSQKIEILWQALAGGLDGILLKFHELTAKHRRLSFDFIHTLKLKTITHYYQHHVYKQLIGTDGPPGIHAQAGQKKSNLVREPENYLDHLLMAPESFLNAHKELNLSLFGKRFVLQEGDYTITRNIIIPKGFSFDIKPGTRLKLAAGVSVVCHGPVNLLGRAADPITIQALDPDSPFGVFVVHGTDDQTCRISHLDFSGAGKGVVNGVTYNRGLAFHNMNLEMRFSKIHHVHSNSGLSVVNGSVTLVDNHFFNNHSDQVTLEFCRGILRKNRFSKQNGDPNGDGLTVEGSEIVVENNRFSNFQDKGLSIGKKSKVLLYQNIINNNGIGVASKDSASVLMLNNQLISNTQAVSAFQKSQQYEGGKCYFLHNNSERNEKLFKIDKFSTFYELTNCQDYELRLAADLDKGKTLVLPAIFSQVKGKCAGLENSIEYFSVGNTKAHIDEAKRIIFVNLPVGSGPRQAINYRCSIEETDLFLNPVMVGINRISSGNVPVYSGKITNNASYDFKEYIYMGELLFRQNFRYEVYDFIVTTGNHGLIKIDTRDKQGKAQLIKDEPKIPCKFVIISPQSNREQGVPDFRFFSLAGKIEGRGQKWPKWKYGIALGKSISISGLEQAKNWVLESSFVEKTLMRSRVAFNLFNQILTNTNKKMRFAPQSRFVEVVLNDEYIGVYLLIQHINKNFLGLAKFNEKESHNAVLYRSRDDNANFSPNNFARLKNKDYRYFPDQKQPKMKARDPILGWHSGFSQRHPDVDKFGENWLPLEEFCRFTALSTDVVFQNKIFSLLDKDLFINLWIFIQFLDDHDGLYKNRYLARHNGNSSMWFFVPWDKDGIFGRSFNMKKRPHDQWLESYLFNRVMQINSFRADFIKRWYQLRQKGIITKNRIFQLIEENRENLIDLQQRNFRKWPADHFHYPDQNDFDKEIDYMKSWIEKRIIWLDNYIDGLDNLITQQ